jgi:hypothetical protein
MKSGHIRNRLNAEFSGWRRPAPQRYYQQVRWHACMLILTSGFDYIKVSHTGHRMMNRTGYSVQFCRFTAILIFTVIAGCATQREPYRIIEKTALPVYRANQVDTQLNLRVFFHIMEGGYVDDVRIQTKTTDNDWNRAAADSMKKWRFTTQYPDSSFWLAVNVKVLIVKADLRNLGELIASDRDTAFDLYHRLRSGVSFHQLVDEARSGILAGVSARYQRDVNIDEFSPAVRSLLNDLETGKFTRPVRIGMEYIIYMRLDRDMPNPDYHL